MKFEKILDSVKKENFKKIQYTNNRGLIKIFDIFGNKFLTFDTNDRQLGEPSYIQYSNTWCINCLKYDISSKPTSMTITLYSIPTFKFNLNDEIEAQLFQQNLITPINKKDHDNIIKLYNMYKCIIKNDEIEKINIEISNFNSFFI